MRYFVKPTLTLCLALFLSGCFESPMPPEELGVDSSIGAVENLKTLSDITEIGFEWTPIYAENIAGYYIYRGAQDEATLSRVGVVNDRYVSHYVDTNLTPSTTYTYQVRAFTNTKQESTPAQINATTLDRIEPIPFVQAINGLPNRVKIIWRPHPSMRVNAYVVERNELNSDSWRQLAEIKGRLNAEYIDGNLKDNYVYQYRVYAKTYDGMLTEPSEVFQAGTKQLPAEVEGLNATRNQPKKIVISWTPSNIQDIAYYKIYRATSTVLFYSLLAQTNETSYTDVLNEDTLNRYYKVTVVDKDGLESPRQEFPVMGTTLGVPLAPVISSVSSNSKSATIKWSQIDQRGVKYEVKKSGSGFDTLLIQDVMGNEFVDTDVVVGGVYNYEIFAIDENGMLSPASQSIRIQIPVE